MQLIILHLFSAGNIYGLVRCVPFAAPRNLQGRGFWGSPRVAGEPANISQTDHTSGVWWPIPVFVGVFFGCVRYCKICQHGLSGWWLFCWTMALFAEIPVARRRRWSRGLSLRSAPGELVGNQVVGNQRACALDQFSGNFGYFGELSCLLFYGDFLGPENAGGTSWRRAMWQTRNFTTYMLSLPLWTGGMRGWEPRKKGTTKADFWWLWKWWNILCCPSICFFGFILNDLQQQGQS